MPRPKTKSDEDVLLATATVLRSRGPHAFTLADVAGAVGLSPATLVQRFGTKRGLLLAFARRAAEDATTSLLPDGAPRGYAELRMLLVAEADAMGERHFVANDLAMLLEDVRDPELRPHARAHAERTQLAIEAHLRAALRAGELVGIAPKALARVLQATWNGAVIGWALRARDGARAGPYVGKLLDQLVAPFRPSAEARPVPTPARRTADTPRGRSTSSSRSAAAKGRARGRRAGP